MLLALEQRKERIEEEEEKDMKEKERDVYSAKGEKRELCCVKMKKVGGVYGEEWIDVSGE